MLFPCACPRKEVGEVYPGACRNGLPSGSEPRSWRVRVDDHPIRFNDRRLGAHEEVLAESVGDFVLKRAEGLFAYQLAVVVDDGWQGITDVVRGSDLLTSTVRQIYLQELLQLPRPSYLHLPVAIGRTGDKLSKQTKAQAIPTCEREAPAVLAQTLEFLGHEPPQAFPSIQEAWEWIKPIWQTRNIPAVKERSVNHA